MSSRTFTPVRLMYLAVAILCWVVTGFGRLARRRVIVLCYHAVGSGQRQRFVRQMRMIAGRVISTSEIAAAATDSKRGLPCLCVTFDDGYAGLLAHVLPATAALKTPITVFVVSGNLGRSPAWLTTRAASEVNESLMSGPELCAAVRNGLIRIGAHSVTHPHLSTLSTPERRAELANCKTALEALVHAPVDELALPYGEYDEQTIELARALGFQRVFSLDACPHPGPLPTGVVGRYLVSPDVWMLEFYLTCAGAYAWLHEVRQLLRRFRRGPRARATAETAAA